MIYKLKTKVNDSSVIDFLNSIEEDKKREDSYLILDLMNKITKKEPKMWGDSIVGFGTYHYKYKSGQEGDWFVVGFSPRKQAISLYFSMCDLPNEKLIEKLGKVKTGKSCVYVKKIEDIDIEILKELIKETIKKNG